MRRPISSACVVDRGWAHNREEISRRDLEHRFVESTPPPFPAHPLQKWTGCLGGSTLTLPEPSPDPDPACLRCAAYRARRPPSRATPHPGWHWDTHRCSLEATTHPKGYQGAQSSAADASGDPLPNRSAQYGPFCPALRLPGRGRGIRPRRGESLQGNSSTRGDRR